MQNSSCQIPGADPFERVDFEANDLDKVDPATNALTAPKLVLRTNTGQTMTFSLTDKSGAYKALAAWSAALATELEAAGR